MVDYVVTRKADGAEIYRYQSDAPIEWNGMEFADHDHTEAPVVNPDGSIDAVPVRVRWITQQQFIDRLGVVFPVILTMAKQSVDIEAWVKRFEMATVNPDGTSVDLDDPRTVTGVTAIGNILEQHGVVSAGWSDEVLHG